MTWIQYLLLVGFAAVVLGSGLAFQQATLHWAARITRLMNSASTLGPADQNLAARRIQDGISPIWLNAHLMIAFIIAPAAIVLGIYHLGWIAGLVGSFVGLVASVIVRGLWPPPGAEFSDVALAKVCALVLKGAPHRAMLCAKRQRATLWKHWSRPRISLQHTSLTRAIPYLHFMAVTELPLRRQWWSIAVLARRPKCLLTASCLSATESKVSTGGAISR